MKLKKTKKVRKMRGTRLHGYSTKKHKGSGNRGGVGLAGTGKRADHKKGMVTKKYGEYFGKKGHTGKSTEKKKVREINIGELDKKIEGMIIKGKAVKGNDGITIDMKEYTILGDGTLNNKIIITAKRVTKTAKEKIEKLGGKINLTNN